jgi:hypothetical protein
MGSRTARPVAQLARDPGLTRAAVCHWWAKRKPTLPYKWLEEISDHLNVRIDWLLTGRGEPMRDSFEGADLSKSFTGVFDVSTPRIVGVVEGEAWREGCIQI